MEYKGLLYAKIQGKYVPTSQSAEDVDKTIHDLLDTIESLKCCGNCKNYGQGTAMDCKKDFDCSLFCKDDLVNHWEQVD